MKKEIIIMNEGVTYDVTGIDDCVESIIEEYNRFDVSMSEILASIEIKGFSVEDVVEIYAKCIDRSDSDLLIRIYSDEEKVDLDEVIESYEIIG